MFGVRDGSFWLISSSSVVEGSVCFGCRDGLVVVHFNQVMLFDSVEVVLGWC